MDKYLKVIIPISIELDWPTRDTILEQIREQHTRFGFTQFALAAPCGGWRSTHYPPRSHFIELAKLYKDVADTLKPCGIECGWWVTTTMKSGHSADFTPIIKPDGTKHPFSNCPLDPNFRKRFAEDVAAFAAIARPSFIFTEDDYSISAADGCFCEWHLQAFAARMGREFTREEIVERLNQYTPENPSFEKAWRQLKKDSMVGLSEAIRAELDKETPDIPMGYMQAGGADADGDSTEAISRALAGARHTPFCRFHGTSYGGIDVKQIPVFLYHPTYDCQHIGLPFTYIHESDTFPHTRYYMAGAEMRTIMAAVYSHGFDGSTFQTQQLLDDGNEEKTYGGTFAIERKRFNTLHRLATQCRPAGVEIDYDPFWNTYDKTQSTSDPLWVKCVSHFGIPYTTLDAPIAFWDERQAAHSSDEEIRKRLSRGLFLDGDAARALCARGYGKYIGVDVTDEDVSDAFNGMERWDLGAREVIREGFGGKGRNMPSAHMFSPPGNGWLRKLIVTDERTEILSDACSFQKKYICPAMTRFENELGGKVVVMGLTLDHNNSQALFNYRRQKLFHDLLKWMGREPAFVEDAAMMYVIENIARNPKESGFKGMVTLLNLCADTRDQLKLHLPDELQGESYHYIDANGELQPLTVQKVDDGIQIKRGVAYLEPLFIVIK